MTRTMYHCSGHRAFISKYLQSARPHGIRPSRISEKAALICIQPSPRPRDEDRLRLRLRFGTAMMNKSVYWTFRVLKSRSLSTLPVQTQPSAECGHSRISNSVSQLGGSPGASGRDLRAAGLRRRPIPPALAPASALLPWAACRVMLGCRKRG